MAAALLDARDRVESKMTPQQVEEAQELAFEWTIEHHNVRRLRALLESMQLDKETLERPVVPRQVQAQAGDLEGSRVSSGVGLHGLILEDRSSKLTRRALNRCRQAADRRRRRTDSKLGFQRTMRMEHHLHIEWIRLATE
jgi:hypothetical protein